MVSFGYLIKLTIDAHRGDEEVGVVKRASSPASTTDLILLPAREGISRPEPRQDTQDFNLPAGQALDLFYRYR